MPEQRQTKARISLDLEAQMAARSSNYSDLMRLIPGWESCSDFRLACPTAGGQPLYLHVQIIERTTYTLTLKMTQHVEVNPLLAGWLHDLKIRIYLDVQSSEVIQWGGRKLPGWVKARLQRRAHYRDKAHSDLLFSEQLRFWRRGRPCAHFPNDAELADANADTAPAQKPHQARRSGN